MAGKLSAFPASLDKMRMTNYYITAITDRSVSEVRAPEDSGALI